MNIGLSNSVEPDAASDQGLRCLPLIQRFHVALETVPKIFGEQTLSLKLDRLLRTSSSERTILTELSSLTDKQTDKMIIVKFVRITYKKLYFLFTFSVLNMRFNSKSSQNNVMR